MAVRRRIMAAEGPPAAGGFFDRSQSSAIKGNVRPPNALCNWPAMADFRKRCCETIAKVCRLRGMSTQTPDAFLVDQESTPEQVLLLMPIIGTDVRAFPIQWSDGGKHARCDLWEAFVEYAIKTYPDKNSLMPLSPYNHPTYGWVLAMNYGKATTTSIRRRTKQKPGDTPPQQPT